MPQLIFTGVKTEDVKALSTDLLHTLARITDAPRDWFTLEVNENPLVFDGEIIQPVPVVQVLWFDRGQSVKDEMARAIDQALRTAGYDPVEIIFESLEKASYYENAEHF